MSDDGRSVLASAIPGLVAVLNQIEEFLGRHGLHPIKDLGWATVASILGAKLLGDHPGKTGKIGLLPGPW